jgi:hypothetical protein
MDSRDSQGLVAGSCEHGDGHHDPTKRREFHD